MKNELKNSILKRLSGENPEEALAYYREHMLEIPLLERSSVFEFIDDELRGRSQTESALIVLLIVVELNFIFKNYINTQIIDALSVFSGKGMYFHYYKLWILPAFNLFILLFTIARCVRKNLTQKMMTGAFLGLKSFVPYASSIAFLIAFILVDIHPLIKDYSMVKAERYNTRVVCAQERNNAIFETRRSSEQPLFISVLKDELDERSEGIKEFHPDYQTKPVFEEANDKLCFIIPLGGYHIWISDTESLYLSKWQYNSLDSSVYDNRGNLDENQDLQIDYLPHSRTILRIKEVD